MTTRLYYDNPYLTTFDARIVRRMPVEGGVGLVLDRTAFYPTSGGQPFDTGWLNDRPVTDVHERDGELVHVLAQDLPDDQVQGRIDWERRFDHMQQHTGQHLLSAAFQEICSAATVSFHLGDEACTIDLDVSLLTPDQVAATERAANQVVQENRPILARFCDDAALATLSLRKPPTVDRGIRIVSIEGYDHSPCGGTHCHATGEIGPVKVTKWERRGPETRVEFLCGWRALRDYARKHETVAMLANALSIQDAELGEVVLRRLEQARACHKANELLQDQLLDLEAQLLASEAPVRNGLRIVRRLWPDRDAEQVRRLALHIAEQERCIALFAISGTKGRLILARSPDVAADLNRLLKEVCQRFGGGGGGQPNLAQGGGLDPARLDEALDYAQAQVEGI